MWTTEMLEEFNQKTRAMFMLPRSKGRRQVQAGAGEAAFEERERVLHPFQPGLRQGGELGEVALSEVGQGTLEVQPKRLDRVQVVRIRRQLADSQSVSQDRRSARSLRR
jgi:hypothetical protein